MRQVVLGLGLLNMILLSCLNLDRPEYGSVQSVVLQKSEQPVETLAATRLQSGARLVLFCLSMAEKPGCELQLLRSESEETSWSMAETILTLPRQVESCFMSQQKDGTLLLLISTIQQDRQDKKKTAGMILRSYDDGISFTAPQPVFSEDIQSITATGGIFEGDSNELMFPGIGEKNGEQSCLLFNSLDLGATWFIKAHLNPAQRPVSPDRNPVLTDTDSLVSEPTTGLFSTGEDSSSNLPPADSVQATAGSERPRNSIPENTGSRFSTVASLGDGTLIACLESDRGNNLTIIKSTDWGESWISGDENSLIGSNARLTFTDQGTLVCVFEDATPRGITMRVSYDRGRSWEAEISVKTVPVWSRIGSPGTLLQTEEGVAIVRIGDSETHEIVEHKVCLRPPEAPRGLSASYQDNGLSLRWNPIKHVAYYMVCRDAGAGVSDENVQNAGDLLSNCIAMVTENQFFDSQAGASEGKRYRVAGVRGSGLLMPNTGSIGELSASVAVSQNK